MLQDWMYPLTATVKENHSAFDFFDNTWVEAVVTDQKIRESTEAATVNAASTPVRPSHSVRPSYRTRRSYEPRGADGEVRFHLFCTYDRRGYEPAPPLYQRFNELLSGPDCSSSSESSGATDARRSASSSPDDEADNDISGRAATSSKSAVDANVQPCRSSPAPSVDLPSRPTATSRTHDGKHSRRPNTAAGENSPATRLANEAPDLVDARVPIAKDSAEHLTSSTMAEPYEMAEHNAERPVSTQDDSQPSTRPAARERLSLGRNYECSSLRWRTRTYTFPVVPPGLPLSAVVAILQCSDDAAFNDARATCRAWFFVAAIVRPESWKSSSISIH